VTHRRRSRLILGILAAGLLVAAGAWTLADTVRGSGGPGLPPDMGREPARRAMRDEAAVIAHRFWRKPITADRLDELVAAIGGHDPRDGDLFVDRQGGVEAVPAGGAPHRLSRPYGVVRYGPEPGHPDRQQATALLREALDRAEHEFGAGR
jgi:hypothetical protein